MDPNFPSHPIHRGHQFVPSLTHFPPSVFYIGVAPTGEGYNSDWGPEEHAFLHHVSQTAVAKPATPRVAAVANLHLVNQTAVAEPATPGVTAVANANRCQWLTGGMVCNCDCVDFDDLIVHLARVHDVHGFAARKLICLWVTERGVCGGEYRRHAMRRHIATHLDHSVSCPECGKSYSRGDSMRAHARKVHRR